MTPKALSMIYAVTSAIIAGLAVLPYPWAHLAATAVATMQALMHGGSTIAMIATEKAVKSTTEGK